MVIEEEEACVEGNVKCNAAIKPLLMVSWVTLVKVYRFSSL